jgi:hypothetical protein
MALQARVTIRHTSPGGDVIAIMSDWKPTYRAMGLRCLLIVSTARADGLEPYAYLRRLFEELPKAKVVEDFDALLPFNVMPT